MKIKKVIIAGNSTHEILKLRRILYQEIFTKSKDQTKIKIIEYSKDNLSKLAQYNISLIYYRIFYWKTLSNYF